jgi:hypothetical protein
MALPSRIRLRSPNGKAEKVLPRLWRFGYNRGSARKFNLNPETTCENEIRFTKGTKTCQKSDSAHHNWLNASHVGRFWNDHDLEGRHRQLVRPTELGPWRTRLHD